MSHWPVSREYLCAYAAFGSERLHLDAPEVLWAE